MPPRRIRSKSRTPLLPVNERTLRAAHERVIQAREEKLKNLQKNPRKDSRKNARKTNEELRAEIYRAGERARLDAQRRMESEPSPSNKTPVSPAPSAKPVRRALPSRLLLEVDPIKLKTVQHDLWNGLEEIERRIRAIRKEYRSGRPPHIQRELQALFNKQEAKIEDLRETEEALGYTKYTNYQNFRIHFSRGERR